MKIYHSLTEVTPSKRPISLAIGMFDGVHTGHVHLLKNLQKHHGSAIVLTFSNHPKSILRPHLPVPTLMSVKQKLQALSLCNIDATIVLPFSKDIAEMTYQIFLTEIYNALPFEHLYIGENDAFGKNLEGNSHALSTFSKNLSFVFHSLPKLEKDGKIISSSWIRQCLIEGDLKLAERLLGRSLSFEKIDAGLIKPGTYDVRILYDDKDTFITEKVTIEENHPFTLQYPGTITFIT